MPKSILPREGLTLEALFAPIRQILLQPLLTGSLLLVRYQYLDYIQRWVSPKAFNNFRSTKALTALSFLFSIGLLRKINNALSRLVLNNFTHDDTWDWSKEVVVVTGGSGGIGALMVQMFADKNITVIALDITPPRKPFSSPKAHFYKLDITSTTSIQDVASLIRKSHGDPTVLINNAGIGTSKTIFDETETEIRRTFDVNTISHFLLVKEFVPEMARENHGHIVTVASMASFLVHAGNVDYTCTKASALAFHEGLGQELKGRYGAGRVRTSIVHPTWIRTPLIERLTSKPEFKDFVLEPETVAEAVVEQVLSGYGGQLILPARLGLMSGVRGFPSWLQESMRNGVNQVLKT